MSSPRDVTVWGPVIGSVALYVASLGMPALEFTSHPSVTGRTTLLLGWFGVLSFNFSWLANPLYYLALIFALRLQRRLARAFSGAALAFGLLSVGTRQWFFDEGSGVAIEKLGPAFYFWMASFVVLLLGLSLPLGATSTRDQTSPPLT